MIGTLLEKLFVSVGVDLSGFGSELDRATQEVGKTADGMKRSFSDVGKSWQQTGQSMMKTGAVMSAAITAPLLAAGAGIVKTAGDFEAGMIRIQIASEATSGEMAAMEKMALDIGKSTVFGASEAASAMEMLAKAGVDTKTILGGAAAAVTNLAAAAGSELDPAASAITDTLTQFKRTAADLPQIVNLITGAVNESKFEFADFTGGMAQAGGVAGSAGLSFEDFAAALAATSSQFASGADAGTSFKTFLLSLNPKTKDAAAVMEQFGLKFFDAAGKMKPIGDIAEQLKTKFAGLSDEARNKALERLFGTDAIRTAVGLMNAGADGLDKIQQKLAATDAADQAAKRMQGFNGQLDQLKGALETLAIKIAQSGLLENLTTIVQAVAGLVDAWSEASPATLGFATTLAVVAAAIGPLVAIFGAVATGVGAMIGFVSSASFAVAAFAGGAATLGQALAYVFPILAPLGSAIAALASAFIALLAPLAPILVPLAAIAAAVALVYLTWKNWDKITAFLSKLYAGVKTYLQDKLGAVFKWLGDKLKAVGQWFFELYDAVVGHSYIPDMVDEIGQNMARLQSLMVDPAKKATDSTKAAFRNLATEVSGVLDHLFPLQAQLKAVLADMATLDKARAKGIIDKPTYDAAKAKLEAERKGVENQISPRAGLPQMESLSIPMQDLSKVIGTIPPLANEAQLALQDFGERLGDSIMLSLRDVLAGRGSLREVAASLLERFFDHAITSALKSVEKMLFGDGGLGSFIGSALSSAIQGRAVGGPVVPGRAYTVGMGEKFVPSQSGRVLSRNDAMKAAGGGGGGVGRIAVTVNGARGNQEIMEMVRQGVQQGIGQYDAVVGDRVGNNLKRRA